MALVDLHAESPPIVHFDIKPENVLLDQAGRAVLTDFGIVRLMEEAPTHVPTHLKTSDGYGTLNYMAPEQLFGKRKAERGLASDMWCLAATVSHMAMGSKPFDGHTILDLTRALDRHQVPVIPESLPSALVAVLRRCLNDKPSARPTAAEVLEVLERQGSPHVSAVPKAVKTGSAAWTELCVPCSLEPTRKLFS